MAHQSIEVNLPLAKVYESMNSPVDFPLFLSGIKEVIKINSQTYEYRTTFGGEDFKWTTNIIDDLRNTRFAWITINGNLNQTGTIRFTPLENGTRTRVDFSLDYRPFFGEAEGELNEFINGLDELLMKDMENLRVALENGTLKEKEETADQEKAAV
ncbi:Polyketide cyclase / dehydrase and lipid transport [Cyclonatronum proteinivorum]|uniref:Polyketide cyclase / dehydrase and lipid transport n=1 Tax=Cyclonatronum proteinivorum TaxID=1457365 RepID=A0A345UJP5_9BACT|nr:SRPBCC family protein [Cyclonatronum proteinivorum]AXJ00697.1 Polyketide cyclase / dehydrase and lipid transport [Cyclonatronum proteinivorum]